MEGEIGDIRFDERYLSAHVDAATEQTAPIEFWRMLDV